MASKRTHEGASNTPPKQAKIDLNYPLSTSSNSSSITPPFIQPPFNSSDGGLTVSVAQPLSINGGSISLNYDNTLETLQGQLSVKVETDGPIDVTENGLTLSIGDGLKKGEFGELDVNFANGQPFDVSNGGITLLIDDESMELTNDPSNNQQMLTVKLDDTLVKDQNGIGINIDPNGPINAGPDGLDIDLDTNTLQLISQNQYKALSVKCRSGGGITSNNGLQINLSNNSGLRINNNGLTCFFGWGVMPSNVDGSITLKSANPIAITNQGITLKYGKGITMIGDVLSVNCGNGLNLNSSNGVSINYDPTYFSISPDNALTLNSYSSPSKCILQSGIGLDSYTAKVMANINGNLYEFKCAYSAILNAANGVVNGYLTIKINDTAIKSLSLNTIYAQIRPRFTFWLCRDILNDSQYNYSNCTANSFTPDTDSVKNYTLPSIYNVVLSPSPTDWYVGNLSNGTVINGVTTGTGNFVNTYNYSCNFSLVKVPNSQSPQLTFTIDLSYTGQNTNGLYDSSNSGTVTIGPIPFWYLSTGN